MSRARVQALIAQEQIRVDGAGAKASSRLKGGERITVEVPPPEPTVLTAEDLPLEILHEDRDLVVIDKAAGMVVHPAAGHARGTLVNALLHRFKDFDVGGEVRPGIVHRLDKDTSGCLVIARNSRTLEALQAAFKGREVEKTYLALVRGHPAKHRLIETPYGRHPRSRKKFSGRVTRGKTAITEWTVREQFDEAALIEVRLHTGRTHQIRVHLSEAGHPLLGDALYGRVKGMDRQALHAWKLAFVHPATKKRVSFEAPPPRDFEEALERLRS